MSTYTVTLLPTSILPGYTQNYCQLSAIPYEHAAVIYAALLNLHELAVERITSKSRPVVSAASGKRYKLEMRADG